MTVKKLPVPTSTTEWVDPKIAERWLGKNTLNRKASTAVVRKYAADMAAGRWVLTGSPIQFSKSGRLLDGQHRLLAVIASKARVQFFVVRNLADESQLFVDTGKKRTVAEQLALSGIENASAVAAATRLIMLWQTGNQARAGSGVNLSDAAIREFLAENEDIHEVAKFAGATVRRGLDIHPSVVSAAFWGICHAGADPEVAAQFFTDLADMATDGEGDPRKALLRRIQTGRKNRERLMQFEALSLLIRTWNAYVAGRRLRSISVTSRSGIVDVPRVAVGRAS